MGSLAATAMAIPSRHESSPGTYFVTSRTWESRALFVTEPMCTLFIETLLNYRQKGAYALHSFVLMPDHFHVLLTPAQDKTLERVVQLIKGGSAYKIGVNLQMRFPVWQRGFSDHRIRDAADYDSHLRYMENNPVQKRLVTQAVEYHWSSSGKYEMDATPQGLKPKERSAVRHG
jgi:REP-associated tyrosine transposase